MYLSRLIFILSIFLITTISTGQSVQEFNTIDIAGSVLEKGLSEIDLGYYPGTLLLHGMAEFAVCSNSPIELQRTVDLFKLFRTGGIKGHGSFISYQYGGSGTPYLVWKKNVNGLKKQALEGASEMYAVQKRSSEGILVPPWVKEGMDQIFIDVAFAVTPYMLYAGFLEGNKDYIDLAVDETLKLFYILKDDKTGLLHQGRGFRKKGELSEDNWTRGNGWGAFALAILIRDLPKSHPRRGEVDELAKQFFSSVVKYQDSNGLWHQEMTDATSYVETSGGGLMLYGLGIALDNKVIDQKYRYNFIQGLRGYTSYIGPDGSVSNTCSGCLCPGNGTKEDYIKKPWIYNDPHAFGPVVLAFTQASKMGIDEITPSKKMGLYTISGSPKKPRAYVRSARNIDVAWENDRIAFRVFGPTVRDKVKNSIDIWSKSVNYPILDKWYRLNEEGKDYHKNRGEGGDFYTTGKNVGCGGIALWKDGKAYQPESYDKFRIIQNQDDHIVFDLEYNTWNVPGIALQEYKTIEMGMGTNLFKVTSTIKSEHEEEITIAIGLSASGKQKTTKNMKKGVLSLWEKLDHLNGSLGTAVIVDPKIIKGFANYNGDEYVLVKVRTNVPFNYYSGAGWDGSPQFKTDQDWDKYIEQEIRGIEF